tara:strand:- start:2 stop:343 length:342 start_codon:yes stop_codon:yes gene_type:complete
MKILKKKKPRIFLVSKKNKIFLKDVGKIFLEDDENLTFVTKNKKNYDICKKNWGFYATPSVNKRLKKEGFSTALTKQKNKYFIMIVDNKKKYLFNIYCKKENYKVVKWLDKLK